MVDDWLDEVAELMQVVNDRGDVDFLELVKGDLQIRFSRGRIAVAGGVTPFAGGPAAQPAGGGLVQPPLAAPVEGRVDALAGSVHGANVGGLRVPEERAGTQLVHSPMVGTFYRASEPGVPPFVEVGTTVAPDTTMGLVEAMKVYTSVHPGVDGIVEEIFADNAGFVEFEQPLFRVKLL